MKQSKVRDRGPVERLVEEWVCVDCVQGRSVGTIVSVDTIQGLAIVLAGVRGDNVQLHGFQGRLLRDDLIDVRLQARVCLNELGSQTAMNGRLDFGPRSGCEPASRC